MHRLSMRRKGRFEMVIADAGIGIRASLFSKISVAIDDQTALENALTMGITRYPDGTGHGTGFRTVFDALASLGGTLRFRSGVAALVLDGTQFRSLTRKLLQRNHFQALWQRSAAAQIRLDIVLSSAIFTYHT